MIGSFKTLIVNPLPMVSELAFTTELSVIRPINMSTKYLSYVLISLSINQFFKRKYFVEMQNNKTFVLNIYKKLLQ